MNKGIDLLATDYLLITDLTYITPNTEKVRLNRAPGVESSSPGEEKPARGGVKLSRRGAKPSRGEAKPSRGEDRLDSNEILLNKSLQKPIFITGYANKKRSI
jgi:hypothetical protein